MLWHAGVTVADLTMGVEMSSDIPFDRAAQTIRNALRAQDPLAFHCDNIASLKEGLNIISDTEQPEGGLLAACKTSFVEFASKLEQYFDFLSTFVRVKPQWRQTICGIMYLTFKTSSRYILFLQEIRKLLDSVTQMLPEYKQPHSLLDKIHPQDMCAPEQYAKLLSYIHTDLAQFSLDLCQMFCRASPGVQSRNVRLFSQMLIWRPLDSRFAQLQQRLLRHRTWIEKEFLEKEEDHATIAKCRREYTEFLTEQADESESEEQRHYRMAKRVRRVDRVKAWLDSKCSYRDVYEHRLKQRHPNTCDWFLSNDQYCRWRNVPFGVNDIDGMEQFEHDWQRRVLFVQAESGFGKTFLSSTVIDDLSAEANNLSIDEEHEPPSTAFYHFSTAHSYCIHPNDAFRALSDQLLQSHRHDRSTLDAVSLLVRKTPSRARASSDEVLSVLTLLLRQHPAFLVLDGIDECSDIDLLLRCITDLCRNSDTRVILFSTPHIKVPNDYYKWATDAPYIVALDDSNNKHDVEAYLIENLHEMADQGYFGIFPNRSLINAIVQRCKDNFLWASSLLKYLQSPILTPDQRRAKLENPHELNGLDTIYTQILTLLESRPDAERNFVAGVFRLLTFGIHSPCMRGFQKALNVRPGQRTIESDPEFTSIEMVPMLTCGLAEVTSCNVIFTHKSVKEFLQRLDARTSSFSLQDETLAHAHLAAVCISFLAFDIPKRPLAGTNSPASQPPQRPQMQSSGTSMRTSKSGDSGYKSLSSVDSNHLPPRGTAIAPSPSSTPIPHAGEWDADLPFLRYASLCWPIHLTRALAPHSSPPHTPAPHAVHQAANHYPWLTSLSTFLTDRAAVTTWVEASWRYNLPPNLSRLVPLLEATKQRTPPATVEGRELRWVVHGMRELNEGLNAVKEGWGHRVREDPGLVWGWRGGRGMI